MNEEELYVVNVFKDVSAAITVDTGFDVNYVYGNNVDVLKNLKSKDGSVTLKNKKYPLFALYMPFKEENAGYLTVTIKKIVFAMLSGKDDLPDDRYTKVFMQTLYPVYESFLVNLAKNKYTVSNSYKTIKHDKFDFFAAQPTSGLNDFVDTLQINNLVIKLNKKKNC